MTSHPRKQKNAIHILPQISRNESNQTIKFGKSIKHGKKFSWNLVEKLFPDSFLKNRNWAYLWINSMTFYL